MKKGKLFLLLGLLGLSLPLAISNVSYQAMAEGGEEEPIDTSLEYEEEQLDDYEQTTVRHYKNFSPVSLEEHFKAPYGCLLKFGYEDENIEKLTNEIANLPGMDVANEVQMFGVVSCRVVNGSKIYANSEFAWNVDINDMTSYLEGVLPTFKLYELEEKNADVSVGAIVEFQCYVKDGDDTKPYVLTFDVEQYHIKNMKMVIFYNFTLHIIDNKMKIESILEQK